MPQKAATMIKGTTFFIKLYKIINNCPNNNNDTYDFASHLKCLFVVFSSYMAIKQDWNNKPNAKANNE